MTRRTLAGVTTEYSYDQAGRLKEVIIGSVPIAEYQYDAYGRLIKTTEGTQETIRLPMGNETAYEKVITPGMPTVERRYIIALGKYIARDEISAGLTSRVYYHGDHLGSTRALSGDDTGSFTYDPFGNIVESMGDAADHSHQFTGKPIQSTGLYYYGARFYDPTLGRFINMDPAKDGNNWWVYCNQNPLRYVDPTGRNALPLQDVFISMQALYVLLDPFTKTVAVVGTVGYLFCDVVTDGPVTQTVRSGVSWIGNTISNGWDRLFNRADSKESADTEQMDTPNIPYPGSDPAKAPGEDWEWKSNNPESKPGETNGNWVNRKTRDSLRPDIEHNDPIGPHWDYKHRKSGTWWRVFPDGRVESK